MTGLTIKQEAFCQAYVRCKSNASEAYRASYDASKMKPATVNRNAKALLDNNKIATRVSELQAEVRDEHNITVNSILAELDAIKLVALAAETPQCSAAVSAVMGKAKITGLDKVVVELTGGVKVEHRSIKDIFNG
ncbi:terminase small subunit [Serratia proteamaculans]